MKRKTERARSNDIEEFFLRFDEEITERAYHKYVDGEITSEQLQEAYHLLSQWSINSEKLIEIVS